MRRAGGTESASCSSVISFRSRRKELPYFYEARQEGNAQRRIPSKAVPAANSPARMPCPRGIAQPRDGFNVMPADSIHRACRTQQHRSYEFVDSSAPDVMRPTDPTPHREVSPRGQFNRRAAAPFRERCPLSSAAPNSVTMESRHWSQVVTGPQSGRNPENSQMPTLDVAGQSKLRSGRRARTAPDRT